MLRQAKTISQAILFIALLGITSLSFTGCGSWHEKTAVEKFNPSAEGKTKLTLENINGNIIIRRTTDDKITIYARKLATVRKRDIDKPFTEIEIKVTEVGEEIKVETIFNKIRRGLFSFNEKQEVEYDIYLPARFSADVNNVNGNISIHELEGDINIDNVNGDITLYRLPGKVNVDIVNGDIQAELTSTNGVFATATNGKMNFNLGDSINAIVSANITNGKIETDDFSFSDSEKEKKSLRGRLGNGDYEIKAEVLNGKIVFERMISSAGTISGEKSNKEVYLEKKRNLENAQRELEKALKEFEKAKKDYLGENPRDTLRSDSVKVL